MIAKLYKVLVKAVADITYKVVHEGAYADRLLADALENNRKWGGRDRSFVVEATQDMLRHYRYLAYLSGQQYNDTAINSWHLVAAWWLMLGHDLPPWDEFAGLNVEEVRQRLLTEPSPAEKLSVPDWLYNTGFEQLQEKWEPELEAMNHPAQVVIRTNTLKTTKEQLAERLMAQGIETTPLPKVPDALVLVTRKHLMKLPEFMEGMFEVQDAASQLVAPMLDAQPGMTVVDACAGGGGKTLHLATLMQNQGKIIACDVEGIKLRNLGLRLKRAGFTNTEARTINKELVHALRHTADRLLLDVPCSGLGVLKRNPDTKWLLDAAALEAVTQVQREILSNYHTMLKPGGKLVYATCSILPQEDEQQVQWFLSQHPEYELIRQEYILPSQFGFDGFYMALLGKG